MGWNLWKAPQTEVGDMWSSQGFLAPKHKMESYMNTQCRRSYGRATLFEKQAWDWEAIIRNIPWDWEDIYYMYMCIY